MALWLLQIFSSIHSKQHHWLKITVLLMMFGYSFVFWIFTVACLLERSKRLDWMRTGLELMMVFRRPSVDRENSWPQIRMLIEAWCTFPRRLTGLRWGFAHSLDARAMWTWEPSSLLLLCTERAVRYNVLDLVLVKREAWGMTMVHRHRWCTRQFSYHVIWTFLIHRGGSILINTDCNFQWQHTIQTLNKSPFHIFIMLKMKQNPHWCGNILGTISLRRTLNLEATSQFPSLCAIWHSSTSFNIWMFPLALVAREVKYYCVAKSKFCIEKMYLIQFFLYRSRFESSSLLLAKTICKHVLPQQYIRSHLISRSNGRPSLHSSSITPDIHILHCKAKAVNKC